MAHFGDVKAALFTNSVETEQLKALGVSKPFILWSNKPRDHRASGLHRALLHKDMSRALALHQC